MATLDDVYCKFGEVSEAAQLVETELGNVLIKGDIEHSGALLDREDAVLLIATINRQTMGQLMKKLKSSDIALELLLTKALSERNRLSHTFYRQHNFRRNSAEGCDEMLKDLETIHEVLLNALKALHLASGIDLDKLEMTVFPTKYVSI